MATHYGEVFWTSQVRHHKPLTIAESELQGDHPIPQHIIDRFKGKVMAITGYEQVIFSTLLPPYRRLMDYSGSSHGHANGQTG